MRRKTISAAIGEINDRYITEAANYAGRQRLFPFKIRSWGKWAAAAVLVFLLFAGGILLFFRHQHVANPDYPNSYGVTVTYTDDIPVGAPSEMELLYFTEEELFAQDTVILKGTVMKLDNIMISFEGDGVDKTKEYRVIATISVDTVYRGNLKTDTVITVLLPSPASNEDTEMVKAMQVGMTGIFMPYQLDAKTAYLQRNGAKITWTDLAEYGVFDGVRFAFLETSGRLIFSKDAYLSVAGATSLEEIEEYVIKMIKNSNSKQGLRHVCRDLAAIKRY